jgi:hypothetical protein
VAKPGKKRADLTVESEVLQPASLRLEALQQQLGIDGLIRL